MVALLGGHLAGAPRVAVRAGTMLGGRGLVSTACASVVPSRLQYYGPALGAAFCNETALRALTRDDKGAVTAVWHGWQTRILREVSL